MSDFKKKFGANLKALRKSRNITQEKLSELINIHYRQMSKIETGDNFPSSKTLEKLCLALKIPPVALFDFDFLYEEELFMTGTENISFYKAIQKNNVITLEDYKGKKIIEEEISLWDSDKRLLKIAKNLNKPVVVEYVENGKKIKTITYNPEGTISDSDSNNQQLLQEAGILMEMFKKVCKNKDYTNFIKLAIQSIEDNDALDKLEFMINGIKLARQQNK